MTSIHEMNTNWYETWKTWRDSCVITPNQCFDDESDFIRRIHSVPFPLDNTQISHSFNTVGELGEIAKGRKLSNHYLRHGSAEETALSNLLVMAEAGYLEESGINPLDHIAASLSPSGMSAISNTLFTFASLIPLENREEKRFIQAASEEIYSDTNSTLYEIMHILGFSPPLKITLHSGQEHKLADLLNEHYKSVIGIYYEPISNPQLLYTNTRALRKIADYYNIPFIVDNTLLTPYLQQQMRLGADIVIHSVTKYISGEGDLTAGAVIGPKSFIDWSRKLQRVTGNTMQSPAIMQKIYQRMRELPERMKIHCRYALQITDYLRSSPFIEQVNNPDLENITRCGSPGGIVSFTLYGEDPQTKIKRETKFMQHIIEHGGDSFQYKVSFGEESYLFFGETTHGVQTKQQPGLIRLAVGRKPTADEAISFIEKSLQHACK